MEWPLAYAPFANIIVEDDDGRDNYGEPSASADVAGQASPPVDKNNAPTPPPQQQQVPQQQGLSRHIHFDQLLDDSSEVSGDEAATEEDAGVPPIHFSLSSRAASLTSTTATTAAASAASTHTSGAPRRVLRLSVAPSSNPAALKAAPASASASPAPPPTDGDGEQLTGRKRGRPSASAKAQHNTAQEVVRKHEEKKAPTASSRSKVVHAPAAGAEASAPSLSTPALSPEEAMAEERRLQCVRARPSSLADCFDWWAYLCYHDTHALFTSQLNFESALRPLAAAGASTSEFYAAMTQCFDVWRQTHWEDMVVLRQPPASRVQHKSSTTNGGRARRALRHQEASAYLPYANAVWYEALRVQRLMTQQLLLFSLPSTNSSGGGSNGTCAPASETPTWWFPSACPTAFLAALGEPTFQNAAGASNASSTTTTTSPFSSTLYTVAPVSTMLAEGDQTATTTALVQLHLSPSAKPATPSVPSHASLLVRVPTVRRMLMLLRVVDALWNTAPTALPFRLPVSEVEAPHYYRRVKDPVSLCRLYEDIFEGIAASVLRSCRRCEEQTRRKVFTALKADAVAGHASPPPVAGVALDVSSAFIDYIHLRERLGTLKANCDDYNGAGSELSRQAHALLGAGARALRDAVAEEEGKASYLQQQHEDPQGGANGGSLHLLRPLTMTELATAYFPASDPADVAPPRVCAAQAADSGVVADKGEEEVISEATTKEGGKQAAPPRRMLQLSKTPAQSKKKATSAAAPAASSSFTTSDEKTDFWVQCDDCRTWHKLATRLDPAPETWTCGNLGIACSTTPRRRGPGRPSKASAQLLNDAQAAAKTLKRAAKDQRKAEREARRARKHSAAAAIAGDATAAAMDEGETPLAAMFVASPDAVAEVAAEAQRTAAAAARRKRKERKESRTSGESSRHKRSRKQRHSTSTTSKKKARTALSTPPSSSSASTSSSSASSSSSDDSSTDSDSESDADSTTSSSASSAARKRDNTTRQSATRGSSAALTQLAQAVAALEARAVHEDPFGQLEEAKRLEKQLNALT